MDKVLSIIVPVYGAEKYLEKNMMTIINQLTPECELILVDDGSKDKSGEICETLSHSHHGVVVIHQKNNGVSAARNMGITCSKGKYLVFVDSDDYVADDYINVILSSVKKQYDLVLFGAAMINNKTEVDLRPYYKEEVMYGKKELERVYSLVFSCKTNEPWDKAFESSIVKKYGVEFPKDVNLGEDLYFLLEYITHINSAKIVNKTIYYHTMNDEGLGQTTVSSTTLRYHNIVFQKMLEVLAHLRLGTIHYQECYETMLQIVTNYCGKMVKQGISNAEINALIQQYGWYKDMLNRPYRSIRQNVKRLILKSGKYRFAAILCKV